MMLKRISIGCLGNEVKNINAENNIIYNALTFTHVRELYRYKFFGMFQQFVTKLSVSPHATRPKCFDHTIFIELHFCLVSTILGRITT